MKTIPRHASNLAPYEVQAFIDYITYRWTPEERHAFASEFPMIYNKIVGQRIFAVENVSIEHRLETACATSLKS